LNHKNQFIYDKTQISVRYKGILKSASFPNFHISGLFIG